jgi:hypothetical protein
LYFQLQLYLRLLFPSHSAWTGVRRFTFAFHTISINPDNLGILAGNVTDILLLDVAPLSLRSPGKLWKVFFSPHVAHSRYSGIETRGNYDQAYEP